MTVCEKLSLDFVNRGIQQRVYAVQGDSYTRTLELSLLEGGTVWDVPQGAAAFLRFRKPDGTGGIYDTLPDGSQAWSVQQGNVVRFVLAPQVLSVPGAVLAQLEIVRGGENIASFTFVIDVAENPSAGVLKSEDYVSWNAWAMQSLQNLIVVGSEEPEAGPVLWFNTAPVGAGAAVLKLTRETQGAELLAQVDGTTYGVSNADLEQSGGDTYNFTVL